MKTAEDRKKVYEILEEAGKTDLLEATKGYVKEYDDVDAKRRKAEDSLKMFGDVDPKKLTEMQNATAILEEYGGKDKVAEALAKAEGFEEKTAEYEKRLNELKEQNKSIETEGQKKLEQQSEALKTERAKRSFLGVANQHFRDEALADITDLVFNRGDVKISDESGKLVVKDGENWTPFEEGGADALKKSFGYAVKDIPGSGDRAADNYGDAGGGGDNTDRMKKIMGIE